MVKSCKNCVYYTSATKDNCGARCDYPLPEVLLVRVGWMFIQDCERESIASQCQLFKDRTEAKKEAFKNG